MTDPHPQQTIRNLLPQLKQRTIDAAYVTDEFGAHPSAKEAGEIFARIEKAVGSWLDDVPDHREIHQLVDSVRGATVALSQGPLTFNGVSAPGGLIGGYLKDIDDAVATMKGRTMDAYKAKFLSRLRFVLTNQAGMTVPIGGALAAEEQLWYWGLQNARDAVQKAYDGMDAIANGNGANWGLALDLVGLALAGAGLFTGPMGKAATELGGLGVQLVKEQVNKQKNDVPGGSDLGWEEVLEALERSMAQIGSTIADEERQLQKNINDNAHSMATYRTQGYDLTNDNPTTPQVEPGAHPDLGADAQAPGVEIKIDYDLVDGLISTHMPGVARQLGVAVKALNGAYVTHQLNRPAGLGAGSGIWLNTLILQLVESVKDLKWEVEEGATQLKLVMKDLKAADGESQKALDEHRKKFLKGSGYEPNWPVRS